MIGGGYLRTFTHLSNQQLGSGIEVICVSAGGYPNLLRLYLVLLLHLQILSMEGDYGNTGTQ